MTDGRGIQFRALVMPYGPIPPSGGPLRERYLDRLGREALRVAAAEYDAAVAELGERASRMPEMDFELINTDKAARREIQRVKRHQWIRFQLGTTRSVLSAAEPHVRMSVKAAVDALNYLEDHELRDDAHLAVHRAAFLKRGLVGCPIVFESDAFWTDCTVKVSHVRVGVSAGVVTDLECSICAEPIEDCDHLAGEQYETIAGRDADGLCTICFTGSCGHIVGQIYGVAARGVARSVRAQEFSLVARPRYPLARIAAFTKDFGTLHDHVAIRRAAEHGHLHCDVDLGPCNGFRGMPGDDADAASLVQAEGSNRLRAAADDAG